MTPAVFACTSGEYLTYSGECKKCPRGTFGESPPSFRCEPCGGAKTTISDGATNITDCVYQIVGCFDNMSVGNDTVNLAGTNKIETCLEFCAEREYLYSAIQNANTCFCSQTNDGTVSSGCTLQCGGEPNSCGGINSMTVYRTGKRGASITTIGNSEVDLTELGLNISGMAEFEFIALGCKDAHVRLMNDRGNYSHNFIEIVIGASKNQYFAIRKKRYGDSLLQRTGSFMDCYSWKYFKISWNNGTITVFENSTNTFHTKDTGFVFDVNHIVISAYGTAQVCWKVLADIERSDECPPIPTEEICECPCSSSNITEEALQEKIRELKRQLTVDVTTTSQYIRKLVCADDPRPSATSVGILFGPILITVLLGLIILADFSNLAKLAIRLKKIIRRMGRGRRFKNKYTDSTTKDKTEEFNNKKGGKNEGDDKKSKPNLKNQAVNMKQTSLIGNSNPIPDSKSVDQSKETKGKNVSHRKHTQGNLHNKLQNKPNAKEDQKKIGKPTNLSTQLNNQKADECNEIEQVEAKVGKAVKRQAVGKPAINNLKNSNNKNSNVSKNVNKS
ncbi:uncharacterized protein LOC133196995 [Saccostrea echinata]|uniref:uncharacterized protein LOC133196995 n=1 Tax=Saccostrea echinata TaxID=191078 RepID=UPI002A82A6B1|nr:uncharacterized protein LOC133196995 [Saccostrea echinata]